MKVIDAVWEKRNLKVDTVEVEIELDDSLDGITEVLETVERKYQYIVVKVPVRRADIMHLLYGERYEYVEDMVFFTRMIDSNYLEYERFIPKNN